jgi:predicted transcriptional regulator
MYPAATVAEHVSLRAAVDAMATGHQRQLLVIDDEDRPIGILVDVDALHALHAKPNATCEHREW